VASTVARLHHRAAALRDAALERALLRLPDLGPQAREVVRELASRVVAKLLHQPTLALKADPEAANFALVVERLFALGDPAMTDDLSMAACSPDRRSRHSPEPVQS
jgi:glutamyl-tRNA reductase